MRENPPSSMLRFFRWFCDPDLVEDIEGDLTELFQRKASAGRVSIARIQFSVNVVKLFRPGIIRPFRKKYRYTNSSPMLKNYFITSIRSLMRSKAFTSINIIGLAVGLATFSLIALYVYHETSFDRYHAKANRIYRIVEDLKTENEILYQGVSSPPMGPTMLKDFPEVESYVRFQNWNLLVQRNGVSFYEDKCYIADSTVFDVFSFDLFDGDRKTALRDPNSIVLTRSMAKKYFGNEEPVGKTLKMDDSNYKVTGVMEDVPENSHFVFTALISFSTWSSNNKQPELNAWFWNGFNTFVLLKENASIASVRAKMPEFITRNMKKGGMYYLDLPLQPLPGIYLEKTRSWENGVRGSKNNLYVLSTIAVFIVLIACFNYVNLASARASRRLKEVGLRKSLGALRPMLIAQFLGESVIITLVAGAVAAVLAWLALPAFRVLVDANLYLSILPNPILLTAGAGIALIVLGIFAGLYPAWIISRFEPLQIFRPASSGIYSHHTFRRVLVAIQFVISITLVAGTMLIYDQLSLVRNQDLGFTKKAILTVRTNGDTLVTKHLDAVKNELLKVPGIVGATGSSTVPGQSTNNLYTEVEMTDGKMSATNINYNFVDHDFLPTYDIKIIAGRNFLRESKADDSTAYLINETAVRDFGWTPEQALGKAFRGRDHGKVIGVFKDFNYLSLHDAIQPLALALTDRAGRISMKIESTNLPETVRAAERKWHELAPHLPFDFSFLDEDMDRLYKADQQLGKAASVFTGLAILIGCLGLLGLTSFAVERRVKEIGIRKVLGASVGSVIVLIAREFILLILIALVIATPVTWLLIQKWETNFTLQAAINPLRFVIAGIAVTLFAWLTISYLSYRAATANPTSALRNE
jgi:putative ABC transport system permease protein